MQAFISSSFFLPGFYNEMARVEHNLFIYGIQIQLKESHKNFYLLHFYFPWCHSKMTQPPQKGAEPDINQLLAIQTP